MTYHYNGYMMRVNVNAKPPVSVFPPSCFLNPLYRTSSLDEAMRWIDAYRNGAQWAVEARIRQIAFMLEKADYGMGMPRDYRRVLELRQMLADAHKEARAAADSALREYDTSDGRE